jgi:serine/threonine-protein kinase RIO1
LSVINGKIVVEAGQLLTIDVGQAVEAHNRASRALLVKAGVA